MELWTILGLSGGRKRRHNDKGAEEDIVAAAAAEAELSFYETTTYQAGEIQNCHIVTQRSTLNSVMTIEEN